MCQLRSKDLTLSFVRIYLERLEGRYQLELKEEKGVKMRTGFGPCCMQLAEKST